MDRVQGQVGQEDGYEARAQFCGEEKHGVSLGSLIKSVCFALRDGTQFSVTPQLRRKPLSGQCLHGGEADPQSQAN